VSLKNLVFSNRILFDLTEKDDAVDSIAYLLHIQSMANQMPGANAIFTNLKDPTEEDECVFERTERRSHETE
jgi:hypothetical protein